MNNFSKWGYLGYQRQVHARLIFWCVYSYRLFLLKIKLEHSCSGSFCIVYKIFKKNLSFFYHCWKQGGPLEVNKG